MLSAPSFPPRRLAFVGPQEKAEEMAKEHGFKLGISKTSFKGNSKVCVWKGRAQPASDDASHP